MNKLALSIILIFFTLISFGQDFKKTSKTLKADQVYETNELLKALELYKAAYSKAESKQEKAYIRFQEAEIYRKTLKYKRAALRYKNAIKKGYQDPKAIFYYASMLQATMKYEEALPQFKLFLEKSPNDSLAQLGYRSCVASVKWMKSPTRYQIENLKKLNSRNSDFGATYGNESGTEVVFTSARKRKKTANRISKVTGQYYTSIFEIYQNRAGKWEDLAALNDTINSKYDDGSPSFSSDYTTMYFTRCKIIKGEYLGCSIFEAQRQPGEYFSSAKYLPIVPDSISVGQPSISKDGLTLYFASDMPGGMGGKDIWKVERKSVGEEFGQPINMGSEINTPGNELYPYIRDNGMLYFSSDYHPGMGQLDIFRAIPKGESWTVYNMKYPINSSADDFAITFKKGKESGMFSSSRKLTELKDKEGDELIIKSRGSDDIYSFNLPKMVFSLTGIIADINTEEYIQEANVEIYGDDGSEMILQTGEEGRFKYALKKDVEYVFVVKKEGYLNAKGEVNTMDLDDSKSFKQEIKMTPIGAPIALDNIFYDFGKWTLTDSSKVELGKLVTILKDNPNITIELGAHTDKIGDETSNQVLSQKRAQSVVDFLVSKDIQADRLSAMGYGESQPQTVNSKLAQNSSFKEGDVLSESFIDALKTEQGKEDTERQEEANQINRRTEFKVLSTRYIPDIN